MRLGPILSCLDSCFLVVIPPHQVYFHVSMELLSICSIIRSSFLNMWILRVQSLFFSGGFKRKYFILPYTLAQYSSNIINKVPTIWDGRDVQPTTVWNLLFARNCFCLFAWSCQQVLGQCVLLQVRVDKRVLSILFQGESFTYWGLVVKELPKLQDYSTSWAIVVNLQQEYFRSIICSVHMWNIYVIHTARAHTHTHTKRYRDV